MADIDIEKKESRPVWPWILGLLLLVALLAFAFWPRNNDPEEIAAADPASSTYTTGDEAAPAAMGAMAQPVRAYVEWATNMPPDAMGLDHEFTHSGLMQLADALAATAEKAPNVNRQQFDSKLNRMREMAGKITENWESTQHANMIKQAFGAGVEVFAEIQQSSFPAMEQQVTAVRQTIDKLDPNTLTLDQKDRVKAAFRESAELLAQMNQNTGS